MKGMGTAEFLREQSTASKRARSDSPKPAAPLPAGAAAANPP